MPSEITVQQYRPSEIIAIFNELLSRQTAQQSANLVFIRGIYLAAGNVSYRGIYYDRLRDEEKQDELTICLSEQQRQGLTSGNLVEIGGTLGRNINQKGYIQLTFNVSRIEVVQNQVIDEDEQKRLELRLKKVAQGFKNVDSILESLIFNDTRPKIALLLASSSITLKDFEAGIRAARAQLDFTEQRVAFTQTANLCATLKSLDAQGYHAIAMIRGGGIDSKTDIDRPEVIETVINLSTPFIAATGHADEKIFLRQVADKWTLTPQGLGQYFSELVETVSEKKTKSRAALTEQIKKQFQQQLATLQKQNKETQEKFEKLTKQQAEAQKQQAEAQKTHKEQIEAANKQNAKLQEQLKSIQKTHDEQLKKLGESHKTELAKLGETHKSQLDKLNQTLTKQQEESQKQQREAQKTHEEQLAKLNVTLTKQQEQQKKQQEENNKRQEELNRSIKEMQATNSNLQKSLSQLTAQNTKAQEDLNAAKDLARQLQSQLDEARRKSGSGCFSMIAAIATIAAASWALFLFL